jgi:hypothetical protein
MSRSCQTAAQMAGDRNEEWTTFFLLFLLQLARGQKARGAPDPSWVDVEALARLVRRVGEAGPIRLERGWADTAVDNGWIEQRVQDGQIELRLTRAGERLFRF